MPDGPLLSATTKCAARNRNGPRITRGVNRLIAVQAWGNTVEEQARFPSDLSGLLTLRVENGQVDWDGFQKSLLLRGVALQP
jgi:hypothetical protein